MLVDAFIRRVRRNVDVMDGRPTTVSCQRPPCSMTVGDLCRAAIQTALRGGRGIEPGSNPSSRRCWWKARPSRFTPIAEPLMFAAGGKGPFRRTSRDHSARAGWRWVAAVTGFKRSDVERGWRLVRQSISFCQGGGGVDRARNSARSCADSFLVAPSRPVHVQLH